MLEWSKIDVGSGVEDPIFGICCDKNYGSVGNKLGNHSLRFPLIWHFEAKVYLASEGQLLIDILVNCDYA